MPPDALRLGHLLGCDSRDSCPSINFQVNILGSVPDEDLVVPRGRARTIAYAGRSNGERPAREFLLHFVSDEQRVRFHSYFCLLAADGRLSSPKQFRKERGNIWAFKAGDARIACFAKGRAWLLTHGFIKKRERWPPEELERAERIRWEHLISMNRGGMPE